MASDKEIKFVLDLDVKEFTEQGMKAKGVIEKLGGAENMAGLIEGLTTASLALGTVGIAAFAMKEALDLTVEGEKIRQIDKQFEMLGETAGIATKELKDGLMKASKGLVDNTDLTEIANKSIVAMGKSAQRLPEILELSRKATQVFGGTVKDNFEQMSQAISTGNAKTLKHFGIVVNAEDAVKKFAAANGVAANQINDVGRRQAIMNAALEAGQKAYGGMHEDLDSATNTLQILKVTLGEVKEVFILAFEKTIGPSVRKALVSLKDFATSVKTHIKAAIGEGSEQAAAQVEILNENIGNLKKRIAELEAKKGTIRDLTPGDTVSTLQAANIQLKNYEEQLRKVQETKEKIEQDEEKAEEAKKGRKGGPKGGDEDIINQEAKLQNEIKFQQSLIAIRKDFLKQEEMDVQTLEQVETAIKNQKLLAAQEHALKLKEINANVALDAKQKVQMISNETTRYQAQARTDEQKTGDIRKKLLDQYQKNAKGAFDGIGRTFKVHSLQAQAQLTDWGARGEQVFKSMETHSTYAFEKMGETMAKGGDIGKATAEAIKGAFLNMLADRAIAEGSILLMSGIGSFNPVQIAAGTGLIVLGGALRTLAGGSGDQVAGATGGGPGVSSGIGVATNDAPATTSSPASSAASDSTIEAEPDTTAMEKRPQRSVHINVAGNYFDTDSSRRQLMDMMRAETDATDFTYQKIGGGV